MEFYTSEAVNDHLTCIRSRTGELMYLLTGAEKAVLVDSCAGVGHLKEYVEGLTDLPVTLLLTHGHVDHAMGAPDFETVYLNEKDISIYQKQCTLDERKGYLSAALGEEADKIPEEEFTRSEPDQTFLPLSDGMTIDAAPFHLDCFAFSGHTPGSMVFLIREMKILILGDACNNSTFLFDEDSTSLEEYKEEAEKQKTRLKGRFDRVFLSHHVMETDTDILNNMVDVCDAALRGTADDIPFEFMGIQAYIAKSCNERFERTDGKSGNVIYNKNKLYKEEQQ